MKYKPVDLTPPFGQLYGFPRLVREGLQAINIHASANSLLSPWRDQVMAYQGQSTLSKVSTTQSFGIFEVDRDGRND
jgi:hypothetical protein